MADTDARTIQEQLPLAVLRARKSGADDWAPFLVNHYGEDVADLYVDCGSHLMPFVTAKEWARFIVEACNNYDALKTRNACLRALLELALPHVEKAANSLATGPVAGPVEHLADDIRQALAKEMGSE